VAFRTAASLLALTSRRLVIETSRSMSRLTGLPTNDLEQIVEVVEQAVAGKVLERSVIVQQTTVWTSRGQAEHFVLLRADTGAVRELALSELMRYAGPASVEAGGGVDLERLPGREITWLDVPANRPASSRVRIPELGAERPGRRQGAAGPALPVRRLVVSWLAALPDSAAALTTDWWAKPREAAVGLNLAPGATNAGLVLGGVLRTAGGSPHALQGGAGWIQVSAAQEVTGLFFVGAVYTGYRETHVKAERLPLRISAPVTQRALLVGLGLPTVTERAGARLTNLYLEAVLWPRLESGRAGIRWSALGDGSLGVFAFAEVGEDIMPLGSSQVLVPERRLAAEQLWQRRVTGASGIEVGLGQTARLVVGWRLAVADLGTLTARPEPRYVVAFRPLKPVAASQRTLGLEAGLRFAF
jgi:hypothetical protein